MGLSQEIWASETRQIAVLVDNESWILPYAERLVAQINANGRDKAALYRQHEDLPEDGTLCFMLGCIHISPPEILARHHLNLVVHESDLPKGRGFAPMTWQILESKKVIDFCLFEAVDKADAGDIYMRSQVQLSGYELYDDLRDIQGCKTMEMVLDFLELEELPMAERQKGEPSTYSRRSPEDSVLDVDKTIREQFDLLRVCDNERYPAFFEIDGHKYMLKIYKNEAA